MEKLWQLKKLSTNEVLNEPQLLPENWGPIFGMKNFANNLQDLSWLGKDYYDQGWFIVGDAPEVNNNQPSRIETVKKQIKDMLLDSDWKVASDNLSVSKDKKIEWENYRKKLRELEIQPDFPENLNWPTKPE